MGKTALDLAVDLARVQIVTILRLFKFDLEQKKTPNYDTITSRVSQQNSPIRDLFK